MNKFNFLKARLEAHCCSRCKGTGEENKYICISCFGTGFKTFYDMYGSKSVRFPSDKLIKDLIKTHE